VTSSPSDTAEAASEPDPSGELAARVAEAVGGEVVEAVATAKVRVPTDGWIEALTTARDDLGFVFFSWLSAIDWSNEVAVGDPPAEPVEERIELLCAVSDLSQGDLVVLSTDLPRAKPSIPTAVGVYAGADWHEREAAEMFGIDFVGHPNLVKLYLPDAFEGHPLRKSFPLLSREVKPWPGTVDVEPMPGSDEPSTENPEA
jgi:NADH-quinone oxidoreductase subunit C